MRRTKFTVLDMVGTSTLECHREERSDDAISRVERSRFIRLVAGRLLRHFGSRIDMEEEAHGDEPFLGSPSALLMDSSGVGGLGRFVSFMTVNV